jgi:EAL domain-containing protein (putative c-di-GMP-specific phosphodiesterase class I)
MSDFWVREHYSAGQTIFREGDWGQVAYLIEKGRINITVNRNGAEEVVATLSEGEMFGEIALIDQLPRTASASVVQDCTLIPISRDLIVSKMKQSDPLLSHLLGLVVSRYRETREGGPHKPEMAADEHALKLRDYAVNQIKIAQYLSDALDKDEFLLYFQPIVHLDGGRLAGFEALIRWNQPDLGFVSPIGFIGVAEDTGLIVPIGRWVLWRAIQALAVFQATLPAGAERLFMSVNLSAKQLLEMGEIGRIIDIIRDSGVDPGVIKLEVTESSLISNPELAKLHLMKLKELGVLLAIDDFGTGYSSLSYLEQFPLDTLKIDRSFVETMREKESSKRITRAITGLANDLDMNCIAEGVEHQTDVATLMAMGCQYGQGYLFSKPLGEAQALEYIARCGAAQPPL